MSLIRLHNLSSMFKKMHNKSKCGSNIKITITTTQIHLTKTDVLKALKQYAAFIANNTINFDKIKINSINCSSAKLKRGSYYKNDNFIMTNLYTKVDRVKKFIITFGSLQDKIKFTEIFEL